MIREAKPKDIVEIVNLIRNSFDEIVIEKLIYSSNKVYEFIKEELSEANKENCNLSFVYIKNNKIIGYINYRFIRESLFLNYIAVDSKFKGCGIGKKLLFETLVKVNRKIKYNKIELDVFEFNQVALKWYKNIGFKSKERKYWYEIEIDYYNESDKSNIVIGNYVDAMNKYERFGFTIFNLKQENKMFNIGIISNGVARLYDENLINNKEILNFIKLNFNSSKCWFISNDNKRDENYILTSIRMEIYREEIIKYFGGEND